MKEEECKSCDRKIWEFCLCDEKDCPKSVYKKIAEQLNRVHVLAKKYGIDIKKSDYIFPNVPVTPNIPVIPNVPSSPIGDQPPWVTPKYPTSPPWRSDDIFKTCPTCGMTFQNGVAYGYVCMHSNCPIFPRVSYSDRTTT